MSDKGQLTLVAQPEAFFHELVTKALSNRHLRTLPETEVYLVNLLNQFMSTENLYVRDANGNLREEPLALMVKEALEQSARQAQVLLFRQVGDVSLYKAGFFQESLNRKSVDVSYYIDMGGTAYQNVAAREGEKTMRHVFGELAERFSTFVDVFAEISEATTVARSEKDLLRMYDLWLQTGSDRAAKTLKEAGIIPTAVTRKTN